MRKLVFLIQARLDLGDIINWLVDAGATEQGARAYVRDLAERCERFAENPAILGRQRDDLGLNARSIPHRSHVIFLRYSDDKLEIARIVHGARDLPALFPQNDE